MWGSRDDPGKRFVVGWVEGATSETRRVQIHTEYEYLGQSLLGGIEEQPASWYLGDLEELGVFAHGTSPSPLVFVPSRWSGCVANRAQHRAFPP